MQATCRPLRGNAELSRAHGPQDNSLTAFRHRSVLMLVEDASALIRCTKGSLQQVSGVAHRVAFASEVSVAEFLESKCHGSINAPLYAAWNKPRVGSMQDSMRCCLELQMSMGDSTV